MAESKLRGVIAAVATPVNEDGSPDSARATKLARYLVDNGCDGLNVLGTTGEATSFSLDERKRVMDAYKAAGLPLDRMMVGTGAAAVADAVALTISGSPARWCCRRSTTRACRTTAWSPISTPSSKPRRRSPSRSIFITTRSSPA
jgi:hypothetical protein